MLNNEHSWQTNAYKWYWSTIWIQNKIFTNRKTRVENQNWSCLSCKCNCNGNCNCEQFVKYSTIVVLYWREVPATVEQLQHQLTFVVNPWHQNCWSLLKTGKSFSCLTFHLNKTICCYNWQHNFIFIGFTTLAFKCFCLAKKKTWKWNCDDNFKLKL